MPDCTNNNIKQINTAVNPNHHPPGLTSDIEKHISKAKYPLKFQWGLSKMGLREECVPVRMQRFAKFFAATYRNWDWSDAPPAALRLFSAFPHVPSPKETTPASDPPSITLSPHYGYPWYENADCHVGSKDVLDWLAKTADTALAAKTQLTWPDDKSLLWVAKKWSDWVKADSENKLNNSAAGKASGAARRKLSKK